MSISRRKGRLSFFIRSETEKKNRSGVNSLQFDAIDGRLFTAGRDSIIRVWNINENQGSLVHTMEHHSDWVTDIILCCNSKNLISASNDTTVKVWNATKGFCMSTLGTHKDYVRVLAYAQHREEVASAGLDGSIFLWDIRTLTALTPTNNTVETRPLMTNEDSTYALAMNPSGTVIVAGGPTKRILVWDPRSRSKPFELRSHADSVRALVVRSDGEEILSGSSDGTIKLWSLGMQRCTDTIRIHSESVFTLQVNSSWTAVYSAGKDRKIWVTDIRNFAKSTLIGQESDPVLKLLLVEDHSQSCLWSATCHTDVNRWPILQGKSTQNLLSRPYLPLSRPSTTEPILDSTVCATPKFSNFPKSRDPLSTPIANGLINEHLEYHKVGSKNSLSLAPDFVIKGGSPIVQFHICPEKRFILTKDSEGFVTVYDVLKATVSEQLGKVSFDEEIRKREKLIYVPNWFTVDLKCGMPIIHLDEGDCLSAYITAADAGLSNEFVHDKKDLTYLSNDVKINYGFVLLRSLFIHRLAAITNSIVNNDNSRTDLITDGVVGVPGYTPVILSDGSGRPLDRFLARDTTALNMRLRRCYPEPKWIMDIVESCKLPKPTRLAFYLVPATIETNADGQRQVIPMNSLKSDCLSANDILLIRKVMEHVYHRLIKLADSLSLTAMLSKPPSPRSGQTEEATRPPMSPTTRYLPQPPTSSTCNSSASSTADQQTPAMAPLNLPPDTLQSDLMKILISVDTVEQNPENIIEIWCGDQLLDPNMNLRSARYFYWKQSGDLILSYLVKRDTNQESAVNPARTVTHV